VYLKKVKILFILLIFSSLVFSQDVQFSQLFSDRLYLNPAFAGIDYCPRIMLSYRNQWTGIQNPYLTYNASFDKYSDALHGGIGIRLMKDNQGGGVFNQTSADFIYSYHVKLSQKSSLKFAFEASVYQQNMNTRDLVYASMINPVQGVIYPGNEIIAVESFFSPDFSTALIFNFRKYFIGLSVSHIPQNIVDLHNEFLPVKYTFNAGAVLPVLKNGSYHANIFIEPNVILINQQNMNMLYYGMYFDISPMTFGVFYRQNLVFHYNAMVISLHLNHKNLTIGYSYDITLSKFIKQTLGTHELSLTYIVPCDKKIRNYNTISCPSF